MLEELINKRKLARKACLHCKESKRKCDDEKPCRRCVKCGLDCFVTDSSPNKKLRCSDSPLDEFASALEFAPLLEHLASHSNSPVIEDILRNENNNHFRPENGSSEYLVSPLTNECYAHLENVVEEPLLVNKLAELVGEKEERKPLEMELARLKEIDARMREGQLLTEKYLALVFPEMPLFLSLGFRSESMVAVARFGKVAEAKEYNAANMVLVDISSNFAERLGYAPSEMIDHSLAEYMIPLSQTQSEAYGKMLVEKCTEKNNFLGSIGYWRNSSGSVIKAEQIMAVHCERNGEPSLVLFFCGKLERQKEQPGEKELEPFFR